VTVSKQLVIDWNVEHHQPEHQIVQKVEVNQVADLAHDLERKMEQPHQMESAPFVATDNDLPGIFFDAAVTA